MTARRSEGTKSEETNKEYNELVHVLRKNYGQLPDSFLRRTREQALNLVAEPNGRRWSEETITHTLLMKACGVGPKAFALSGCL